ncbi:FxLYD domain-containing protein [Priestia megaterium]|uniref:FxLYD domain-containing protein n=1 Tax=Priestia megaterium TaxID=1404 RepID=UPI00301D87ED
MKLRFSVVMLLIVMAIAGCTNDNTSDSKKKKQNEEKKQEIKVVEEKSYKYDGKFTYTAVIKNESKKTLNINNLKINYVNKKDKVDEGDVPANIQVAPYILKPGEKAYISAQAVTDLVKFKNYDVKITLPDIKPANDVMKLAVNKKSVKVNKDIEDDETIYIVGTVRNNTKKFAEYTIVGAGMYGENHEFIGTAFGESGDSLKPGDSSSFDISSQQIPRKDLDKVKEFDVSATTYFNK